MDWEMITNYANVVTLVTGLQALIATVLGIRYFWKRRKFRLGLKRNKGVIRRGMLIVSIGNGLKDIEPAVFEQINRDKAFKKLKGIPDKHIFRVQEGNIATGTRKVQIKRVLDEVREKKCELMAEGVGEVYFFFAGPSMLAAMIGAILSNGFHVICCHHSKKANDPEKPYEIWWPLE